MSKSGSDHLSHAVKFQSQTSWTPNILVFTDINQSSRSIYIFVSSIDLTSGYHQCPADEGSLDLLSIIILNCKFNFMGDFKGSAASCDYFDLCADPDHMIRNQKLVEVVNQRKISNTHAFNAQKCLIFTRTSFCNPSNGIINIPILSSV